jgi:hypothetical protein
MRTVGSTKAWSVLEIGIRFALRAVVRNMSVSLMGLPEMIPAVLLASSTVRWLVV